MLADWAEAIDGKLYVMGGGFTTLHLRSFERPHRCALAAVLRVPRADAGTSIPVAAHVDHLSGKRLDGWSLRGELQTPKPDEPGVRDGTAVLAGPVELHVTGPAKLVLRFTFGSQTTDLPLEVLAA